jgi:hypothetical protein
MGDDPDPKAEPMSCEINTAIEVLKRAQAPNDALLILYIWNSGRLCNAAVTVASDQELRDLFVGLGSQELAEHAINIFQGKTDVVP